MHSTCCESPSWMNFIMKFTSLWIKRKKKPFSSWHYNNKYIINKINKILIILIIDIILMEITLLR